MVNADEPYNWRTNDPFAIHALCERGFLIECHRDVNHVETMLAAGFPMGERGRTFLDSYGGMVIRKSPQRDVPGRMTLQSVIHRLITHMFGWSVAQRNPVSAQPHSEESPIDPAAYNFELSFDSRHLLFQCKGHPDTSVYTASYSSGKALSLIGVAPIGDYVIFVSEDDNDVMICSLLGNSLGRFACLGSVLETLLVHRRWHEAPSIEMRPLPESFHWPDSLLKST